MRLALNLRPRISHRNRQPHPMKHHHIGKIVAQIRYFLRRNPGIGLLA